MATNWVRQILLFILLVFLQVWIFNKISLFGVITPLFYIYFIIKLPINASRNLTLFLSFLIGFFIDIMNYSLGLNMLACSVIGITRPYVLRLFTPRDVADFFQPSIAELGLGLFLRYTIVATLIHHIILFLTESFSLLDPLTLSIRIFGSVILTTFFIICADGLNFAKTSK